MAKTVPDYYHRRMNNYVPAMGYASDVVHNGISTIDLGTPIASDPNGILAASAITTALDTSTFLLDEADATYGRNVILDLSGAGTPAVVVYGRDYLGQPMRENFTGNGTTSVNGKKAFKWIDRVTSELVSGVTLDLGFGDVLGLPYKTVKVLAETSVATSTGVKTVQTVGTFVVADETDPATGTTGDPRGTYDPTVTLAATTRVLIDVIHNADVNSSGNGGLHGIKHYYA